MKQNLNVSVGGCDCKNVATLQSLKVGRTAILTLFVNGSSKWWLRFLSILWNCWCWQQQLPRLEDPNEFLLRAEHQRNNMTSKTWSEDTPFHEFWTLTILSYYSKQKKTNCQVITTFVLSTFQGMKLLHIISGLKYFGFFLTLIEVKVEVEQKLKSLSRCAAENGLRSFFCERLEAAAAHAQTNTFKPKETSNTHTLSLSFISLANSL